MTPVLPIVMMGVALVLACISIAEAYVILVNVSRQKAAVQVEPERPHGHVDLEETKLEPRREM